VLGVPNGYSGRPSQFYGLLLLNIKRPITVSTQVQWGLRLKNALNFKTRINSIKFVVLTLVSILILFIHEEY